VANEVVTVPDLGGAETVDVIEISVAPGDMVELEQSLLVLESDKATMEIPSPFCGKVLNLLVAEGDAVSEGSALMELEVQRESAAATVGETATPPESDREQELKPKPVPPSPEPAKAPVIERTPEPPPPAALQKTPTDKVSLYAGPAARQLARKLGVDLTKVTGSGPKGRVLKEDIHQYVKNLVSGTAPASATKSAFAAPPIPDIDFAKFGAIEDIKLSKIARLTASNMARNWQNVPHVTQFDDADISEVEAFRYSLKAEAERRGSKLTPLPFLLMACAHGLKANPVLNRSWHSSGEKVIQKHFIHIGLAVDSPRGLLVPVIRNVDQKGLWDLADEVSGLVTKAREGTLTTDEMQGGCFTISSLGALGGTGFTPIVNSPESAILAVSKTTTKPLWDGENFVPRKMLPLGLSYDHRLVNGADAGRFLTYVVEVLGDMRRLLL